MKRTVGLVFSFLCLLMLSACTCEHDWVKADCENPQKCTLCDEVEGTALGHEWIDADCENPKTCSRCAIVEGEALGHKWQEATCTTHKTCIICQKKGGVPTGHNYVTTETIQEPTCTSEGIYHQKCTSCGKIIELTEPHSNHEFKITHNGCTVISTCRNCGYEKQTVPYSNHKFEITKNGCTVITTCKNCDYEKQTEEHKEWFFSSNYYIETCNIEELTFYGTVTCKGCWKTKEGHIKYSSKEFEDIFCSWVYTGDYEDIARYPEENDNYVMKFTGYILQDCGDNLYRMSTRGRYDDVIMVEFVGKSDGRILEDDRVTVYGEPELLYTYTSTSGAKITIPKFIAYYIHR